MFEVKTRQEHVDALLWRIRARFPRPAVVLHLSRQMFDYCPFTCQLCDELRGFDRELSNFFHYQKLYEDSIDAHGV